VLAGLAERSHRSLDISEGVPATEIIDGLQTIVQEAQRQGIKDVTSTLTPCFGSALDPSCTQSERQRGPVNDWVLHGGVPDYAVDFNAAVSTGLIPETWLPI